MESSCTGLVSTWKDVLDRLLSIAIGPVKKSLLSQKASSLPDLSKNCCHLLARVIAELVQQCNATEVMNNKQ